MGPRNGPRNFVFDQIEIYCSKFLDQEEANVNKKSNLERLNKLFCYLEELRLSNISPTKYVACTVKRDLLFRVIRGAP